MNVARQAGSGGRDVAALLLSQAGMLLASVAVQSLLAWLLLPAGRGIYAVLVVVATLVPSLFAFGLDRGLQYLLMSRRIGVEAALAGVWILALFTLVCSWVSIAWISKLGLLPEVALRTPDWAALLLLCLGSFIHGAFLRLHVATRGYRNYLVANALQCGASVMGLLIALLVLDAGHVGAIMALAASYLISGLWSTLRLHRQSRNGPTGTYSGAIREGLVYGVHVYPASIAHALDFNAGVLILAVLATNAEVGVFAAVSALMLRVLLLPQAIQEAMLPRVAEDSKGRPELVQQMSRLAVTATFAVALLICTLSPVLIAVLLSPSFLGGVVVMWWLAPGVIAHASSTVLMPHFEGRGKPGAVSLAAWIGLLVNALSIFALYPGMGIAGAGLAMSMGLIARWLVLHQFLKSDTGATRSGLLIPRRPDLHAAWGMALHSARRR